MADTAPTAPGPSPEDVDLARKALGRGWISLIQLNDAITQRPSDILTELRLNPQQVKELRSIPPRPLPPDAAEALKDPKKRIGRYLLLNELGGGGMGVVHRGWDVDLHRGVALKFLRQAEDPTARAYFKREAMIAGGLDHPNIGKVYEVGEHEGVPFIAMQFIEGKTLGELAPGMKTAQKLEVVLRVAEAIDYAHGRDIIHRDLKPSNVMLDGSGRPFVLDFGLGKEINAQGADLTNSLTAMGTPQYMAPEQARGNADKQSDVYGIGAVLYHIMTGHPPFTGDGPADVLMKVMSSEPIWPRVLAPGIPEDVEAVILKAMEKDRSVRYKTAREMIADLEALERGEPLPHAVRRSLSYVLLKRIRRQPALWAVAAALVLVIFAAVGFGIRQSVQQTRLREAHERRQKALQRLSTLAGTISEEKRALRRRAPGERPGAALEQAIAEAGQFIEEHPNIPQGYFVRARGRLALWDLAGADRDLVRALAIAKDFRPGWTLLGLVRIHQFLQDRIRESSSALRERSGPILEQGISCLAQGWEPGKERQEGERWGLAWTAEDGVAVVLAEALRARYQEKSDERAIRILDEGWTRYRDEEILTLRAICERDNAKMAEILGRAIETAPGYAPPYAYRGWVRITVNQVDGALADFEAALRLREGFSLAHLGRGLARQLKQDFDGAIAEYEGVMRLDPNSAFAFYLRAMIRLRAPDLDGALADLNRSIEISPDEPLVYMERASIRKEKGDIDGAFADYSKAIEIDPKRGMGWHNRGLLWRLRGDFIRALADLIQAVELMPDDLVALHDRGVVKMDLKDYDGAKADFDACLAKDPEFGPALCNRGGIKWIRGDRKGALEDYNRGMEKMAPDPLYLRNRGMIRQELGDLEGALVDLRASLDLKPGQSDVWHRIGNCLQALKKHREAVTAFTRALEFRYPDTADGLYSRALARADLGDNRGAIEDLSLAIRLRPSWGPARHFRGLAWFRAVDNRGALLDLSAAVSLELLQPGHAWLLLGRAAYTSSRHADAAVCFTKSLQFQASLGDSWYWRGNARILLGDRLGCISDLTVALNFPIPELQHARYLRGRTFFEIGDFAAAERDFTGCAAYSDARFWRGRARFSQQKHAEARDDFEFTLSKSPAFAEGWYWLGVTKKMRLDFEGALADLGRAIALQPDYAMAFHARGLTWLDKDDFGRAEVEFTKAIEFAPEWAEPYGQRGWLRRFIRKRAEAVADLTKALELDPEYGGARSFRGMTRFELRDWKGAIEDWEGDDAFAFYVWVARVRLGAREAADRELRAWAEKQKDWTATVARYLLGGIPELKGETPAQSCEAHFFMGCRKAIDGDREGARAEFRKVRDIADKNLSEYWTAEVELEALGK